MPLIKHKNSKLTVLQMFFIERSIELLYTGTIDTYRVRLNNSKSILEELRYCLVEFSRGRIKHFQTIKSKEHDGKAIVDEVIFLIEKDIYFLVFTRFSKAYFIQLLKSLKEDNYKKVISCIDILLSENVDYLANTIDKLEELINSNDKSTVFLENIDITLNTLFSELINKGFSKSFLYKFVYAVFIISLDDSKTFKNHFKNFKSRVQNDVSLYTVIFRIDTTKKVYEAISTINSNASFEIYDNINDISKSVINNPELINFNTPAVSRKFMLCNKVKALDYFFALKLARIILSEYLDILNLGLSDETLDIHHRVLIIDNRSPEKGALQNNINFFDGKYKVTKEHYQQFTSKIPLIVNHNHIAKETKEKIKSAVRYLRLGNQSTEVEHKFINYWIGLEYLFSNYESQSTINRLKEHLINAHSLAYVKRNVLSFKKTFDELDTTIKKGINKYTEEKTEYLIDNEFYLDIENKLLDKYPLLTYRAVRLKSWLFESDKEPNATKYLKKHQTDLEIHLTRIYRLRNEIIHDAATNTNNEQITSNLRYYLTFFLNELIDFFSNTEIKETTSIDDFFMLNELKVGNIKHGGYKLIDLMNINCSIDFTTS